jgi:hypothetical protein
MILPYGSTRIRTQDILVTTNELSMVSQFRQANKKREALTFFLPKVAKGSHK